MAAVLRFDPASVDIVPVSAADICTSLVSQPTAIEQACELCCRLRDAPCCACGNCGASVHAVVVEGHYVAIAILVAILSLLRGVYSGAILLIIATILSVPFTCRHPAAAYY